MTFSFWVKAEGCSSKAHLHTYHVDGQICGKFAIFDSSFILYFYICTVVNPNCYTIHAVFVYPNIFTACVLLSTKMLIKQGSTTANLQQTWPSTRCVRDHPFIFDPSPPKNCRCLKWMVPNINCVSSLSICCKQKIKVTLWKKKILD